MPKKIWVPQPATRLYGAEGMDPQSMRDRFVQQYGESTVTQAELSTTLDIMMMVGMIKPSEFIEVMARKLHRIDEHRRAQARLEADRG